MNKIIEYDVVIVGAGPIGIACALACKQQNLKFLVIEKGCLVNSIYNYPQHMTFFSTAEKLEIGNIPFVCIQPKPNRNEALEYYRRVSKVANLNIHLFEEVVNINSNHNDGRQPQYKIKTSKSTYISKNIITLDCKHRYCVKCYNKSRYFCKQCEKNKSYFKICA